MEPLDTEGQLYTSMQMGGKTASFQVSHWIKISNLCYHEGLHIPELARPACYNYGEKIESREKKGNRTNLTFSVPPIHPDHQRQ